MTCSCQKEDLTAFVESPKCVTAIDCDAYCALGEDGFLRLFFCAYPASCTQDSDCIPAERCVRPPGEHLGACSSRAVGTECFTNSDCGSNACVVDSDDGRARCGGGGAGAECNRDEHCASQKCLLAPNDYQGVCTGPDVGSPCLSNDDCSKGLACAPGVLPVSATRPSPAWVGLCTNGFPGSPCSAASDCLGGYVCLQSHQCSVGNLGDPCDSNADCPGNFCSHLAGSPVCTSGEEGAPCADPSECRTSRCTAGRCGTGAPGSQCFADTDCVEGVCVGGSPNLCSSGALGEVCDNSHPCQAGLACKELLCQPN